MSAINKIKNSSTVAYRISCKRSVVVNIVLVNTSLPTELELIRALNKESWSNSILSYILVLTTLSNKSSKRKGGIKPAGENS